MMLLIRQTLESSGNLTNVAQTVSLLATITIQQIVAQKLSLLSIENPRFSVPDKSRFSTCPTYKAPEGRQVSTYRASEWHIISPVVLRPKPVHN